MIPITEDVEKVTKYIRSQVIKQSGVPAALVRDGTDEYGTILDKTINGTVFDSILPTECAIIFELEARNNDSDVSYTDDEGIITYYKSYTFYVKIYGDDSCNVANKTIARMRTEKVRRELWQNGVYLQRVTDADEVHDFINSRIWLRNDFQIDITVRLSIQQVSQDEQVEALSKLEIIKI